MNLNKAIDSIVEQLKDFLGDKKAIIGLSGGIDSTVTAYLCVRAVGKDNVVGISMPSAQSTDDSKHDGALVAEKLDIPFYVEPIGNIVRGFFGDDIDSYDPLTIGNTAARVRMTMLYKYSNQYNGMVVGTTNKTEAVIGYYTKYGDGAVDVEPIADLYKTEVWEAGRILGVPEHIIEKKPSAELWNGQTDEEELGITYEEMDDMLQAPPLWLWTDNRYGDKGIRLKNLIESSEHKRHMPPTFKVR